MHTEDADTNIGVDTVTDSPEPKPETAMDGVTPSSGKPKLAAAKVTETFGVMVNVAVPVFTPSETVIVWAPPGSAGTATSTSKLPVAVVVSFPPTTRLSTARAALLAPPALNHDTDVSPTVVEMVMVLAGLKPLPVTTMVDPTVPDVAAVRTPLDIVDRDTVGLAA